MRRKKKRGTKEGGRVGRKRERKVSDSFKFVFIDT